MSVGEAAQTIGQRHSIWVTDENGRLIGWVDRASLLPTTSLSEAISSGEAGEISVSGSATLREALSRMLGQGFQSLPITDEAGQLIGEVTLNDIEAATAETEPKNA
jgi:Mg/Co/Ni transporter MgtE